MSEKYWFHAKQYGWGWGLPARWQGWAILGAYVAVISAVLLTLTYEAHGPMFVASLAVPTVLLILVFVFKGEPPKWRWGKETQE